MRAPTFVGRERELAELAQALSATPALVPRVVFVEGEAGVGKSRLLKEFWATNSQPHRLLLAGCPPFREPFTLGALVDALRRTVDEVSSLGLSGLGGALRPLFPEWADELPPALEPMPDASASRHRVFRAIAELLERLGVTVVVLEDAHWADDTTLEFLLFLISTRPFEVSVVVTLRPEEVSPDSPLLRLTSRNVDGMEQRRVRLTPLDVDDTARMVSGMLADEPLSAEFAEFVHRHTDGLPLAVEESVRLMLDRAELIRHDGSWLRLETDDIVIPPILRDATLERVSRLDTSAQQVLAVAAVLAQPASEDLIAQVAGASGAEARVEVRAGVTAAVAAGLLRQDERGRLEFSHALVSHAVYDTMPAPQRRSLHQRAGEAVAGTSSPPYVELTRHFREAGDVPRWSEYGERAADLALSSGDRRAAGAILHDLISGARLEASTVIRLVKKLPQETLDGDQLVGTVQVLKGVVDDAANDEERGAARALLGSIHWMIGAFDAARVELEAAAPYLEADPTMARVLVLLAWPRDSQLHADTHVQWLRRAETGAEPLVGFEALRFQVNRMCAQLLLGLEVGWANAEQLATHDVADPAIRMASASVHLNAGHSAVRWGRYADAERWLTGAARLWGGYENRGTTIDLVEVNRASLDWYRGSWDGLPERVADLSSGESTTLGLHETLLVAGMLAAARGEFERAETTLRSSLEGARRAGAADYSVEPAAALARLLVLQGRFDEALQITLPVVEVLVRKGMWLWATDLVPVHVEALLATGRLDAASELVADYGAGLGERDIASARAGLVLSRARLAEARGELTDAERRYGEAVGAWRLLPRPYDSLLALEQQAECRCSLGDQESGATLMTEAFHGLDGLGARADADRVLRRLRDLGVEVHRPRGGGRPSYGNELSPRELEVVRLVRRGLTNREIAETLVLATQTVAGHVRSAMRKVGVSSRTALAVRTVDHDD